MCPPPGDLSNPGIEPLSLKSPALAGRLFTTSNTWEALWDDSKVQNDIIQITNCWLSAWFSFIQPSSQDCLGCLMARQLDSIRRVLSGENRNFRSLKTWLQRLQNIISATYYWWKWVTVPAQNQCGMGTMQRCEHWEVWFTGGHFWRLATTKHILSLDSNSLASLKLQLGRFAGMRMMVVVLCICMGMRLRGSVGCATGLPDIKWFLTYGFCPISK